MKNSNFKDGIFHNTHPTKAKSLWEAIKMRVQTEWATWPDWVEIKLGEKPQSKVEGTVKVTFINHATFLIQGAGYNILTDPVYSKRCSPFSFAGPKRVHAPAIPFEDLPKIDVILISHDHYDHLDLATIESLVARDNPQIYAGLGVSRRFDSKTKVSELDWWQSAAIDEKLKVTFAEVQHFSGRTLFDRNTTLWGGFIIHLEDKKIYFGGDSGYGEHYKKTFDKYGAIDLALLPIGAYAPRAFMGPIHMDPKQAVQAHLDLQAKKSIGMHYGTFQLTAETRDEPESLLVKERQNAGLKDSEFITLELGQFYSL